jgi:hypothetical protein
LLPGYQLAEMPKWSMALTTNYDWALTDAWDAHVGGALRWIDKATCATSIRPKSHGHPRQTACHRPG